MAKKDIQKPTSLTYLQALDEALCYGWIDSRGRKRDDTTHIYRFTPRAAKGMWSKRNIGFVERLIEEGRMEPAGLATVEAAKADGRWDAAYSGPSTAEVPQYFLDAVSENLAAKLTWDQLNRGNRYAIYMRLVSLKTDAGREKRTKAFVEMLASGETLVPQKGLKKPTSTVNAPASKASKRKKLEEDEEIAEETIPSSHDQPTRMTRSGRQAPSCRGQG